MDSETIRKLNILRGQKDHHIVEISPGITEIREGSVPIRQINKRKQFKHYFDTFTKTVSIHFSNLLSLFAKKKYIDATVDLT